MVHQYEGVLVAELPKQVELASQGEISLEQALFLQSCGDQDWE